MKDFKERLRRDILKLRMSLPAEEVREKSVGITEKLVNLECFKPAGVIMCYMDFKNEVMTCGFITRCFDEGKTVAVPLVEDKLSISAYEIKDMDNDLQMGQYGIMEPRRDRAYRLSAGQVDIVVVPGVVFDLSKNRIGYGAAYYDRFLNNVRSDCVKIGIAFEEQLISKIPVESHDIKMDLVITDKRIIQ